MVAWVCPDFVDTFWHQLGTLVHTNQGTKARNGYSTLQSQALLSADGYMLDRLERALDERFRDIIQRALRERQHPLDVRVVHSARCAATNDDE